MTKVIAFDLDATLINAKNEIIGGQKTIDYLKLLHGKGYELIINTGRLDHDIEFICQKYSLPIAGKISQNGAVISYRNVLSASILDKQEALEFYDRIQEVDIRVEMNTVSNRYWHDARDPEFPKEFYDSSHIVSDFKEVILNQPVVLFLLIGDSRNIEEARKLVENNFAHLQAFKTSKTSLEILSQGINKGSALRQIYGDELELFAIGDSENDFSMFDIADKAYIVYPELYKNALQVKSIDVALKDIVDKE